MKRSRPNPRSKSAVDLQPIIAKNRLEVEDRDKHTVYNGETVYGRCIYHFSDRLCPNKADDYHERMPRSRLPTSKQALLFVPENVYGVCREHHTTLAQTKLGRDEIAEIAGRVYGYKFRPDGWWESYRDPKGLS